MMIPFGILLALVVYLIYARSKFEKDIVQLYEKKFEDWKENSDHMKKDEPETTKLVGLIFKTGYKVDVELFEEENEVVQRSLEKGKYQVKIKKD